MALHEAPLVCASKAMRDASQLLVKAVNANCCILMSGPSGSGKGRLARFAHDQSTRRSHPFVVCSLADIQESLVQGELFGHVRSAFSGAERDRQGIFRAANGGTVLLDDVDKSSSTTQACLLRFLDDRKVRPVGSDETIPVDVQVIAATNQDLDALAERGRFLGDLRWRLGQVIVHIPPLRERREDIAPMVRYLAEAFGHDRGWSSVSIDDQALTVFEEAPLAGNMRDLANAVLTSVLSMESGTLTAEIAARACGIKGDAARPDARLQELSSLSLEERRSKATILAALELTRWRIGRAAQALGIPLRTFQRDCQRHSISVRKD
jgi:DNA-binding NtrC family response regulator